jgi:hypothetical protein
MYTLIGLKFDQYMESIDAMRRLADPIELVAVFETLVNSKTLLECSLGVILAAFALCCLFISAPRSNATVIEVHKTVGKRVLEEPKDHTPPLKKEKVEVDAPVEKENVKPEIVQSPAIIKSKEHPDSPNQQSTKAADQQKILMRNMTDISAMTSPSEEEAKEENLGLRPEANVSSMNFKLTEGSSYVMDDTTMVDTATFMSAGSTGATGGAAVVLASKSINTSRPVAPVVSFAPPKESSDASISGSPEISRTGTNDTISLSGGSIFSTTDRHSSSHESIRLSTADPSVLVGKRVVVEGHGEGEVQAVKRFLGRPTEFLVSFDSGKVGQLPLKRSEKKGKVPFSIIDEEGTAQSHVDDEGVKGES